MYVSSTGILTALSSACFDWDRISLTLKYNYLKLEFERRQFSTRMSSLTDYSSSRKASTAAAKAQEDAAKAARERAALRQREAARAYLEREGCGPGAVEQALNKSDDAGMAAANTARTKTTDNTLELLLRTNALEKANAVKTSSLAKVVDTSIETGKSSVSSGSVTTNPLPPDWKEVTDAASGKTYFWNTRTNQTSWTRPAPMSSKELAPSPTPGPTQVLPDGWSEHIHPATKQRYYRHTSGKTSATLPAPEASSSSSTDSLKRRPDERERQIGSGDGASSEKIRRL
jgi:hypothetical protein